MVSIGSLSKKFKISRSALLYYDRTGLLKPSDRTDAGYRVYSEENIQKLSEILTYRDAGLSISEIKKLLDGNHSFPLLMKRLGELNREILALKTQQQLILELMKNKKTADLFHNIRETTFEKILSEAGIDFDKREDWHAMFEEQSPEKHREFLKLLGLDKYNK